MLAAERQAHATATPAPSHTKAEPLLVVGHIQLGGDRLQDLGDRGVVLLGKLPRGHLVRLRRLHRHLLPRRVLQQLGDALALTYRIQQQQVPLEVSKSRQMNYTILGREQSPFAVWCEQGGCINPLSKECKISRELLGAALAELDLLLVDVLQPRVARRLHSKPPHLCT